MDKWMDGWMDGWVDGWINGWMDGWEDWWMDGRKGILKRRVLVRCSPYYLFWKFQSLDGMDVALCLEGKLLRQRCEKDELRKVRRERSVRKRPQ